MEYRKKMLEVWNFFKVFLRMKGYGLIFNPCMISWQNFYFTFYHYFESHHYIKFYKIIPVMFESNAELQEQSLDAKSGHRFSILHKHCTGCCLSNSETASTLHSEVYLPMIKEMQKMFPLAKIQSPHHRL